MPSCLQGASRAYGLDLDIIKAASSSSLSSSLSGRSSPSSQTSSPSSTLSESSNSPPGTISFKRPRAPRKRPNQTYNEACALLSTIYPNIFPTESLKRPSTLANHLCSFDESSELLPPFPVLNDAAFLIREPTREKPSFLFELKASSPVENSCTSPTSNEFREPGSPRPLDEDFDTESILDEEIGEGIESIMGNLKKSNTTAVDSDTSEETKNTYTSHISPYIRSLLGFQLGSKFELGLGFRRRRNLQNTALRQRDDTEWWRYPAVPIDEIAPKLKNSAIISPSLDKKKKKVESKEEVAIQDNATTMAKVAGKALAANMTTNVPGTTTTVSLKEKIKATGLGLKLNHEEVIKEWSGQGSMFSDCADSPNSSAETLAKLADIDLFVDGGVGGVREASVLRYKEKRRSRLFSKKIRYQVRKVNADKRPRMKGRFVRRPALLQQAIDEES